MPFTEDLKSFLSTKDFAVSAIYNGVSVDVIFDSVYFEESTGLVGFQGSAPMATALTSDVPNAAHGDTLVISSVTYKVVGVEPDGTGITVLRLEKQ